MVFLLDEGRRGRIVRAHASRPSDWVKEYPRVTMRSAQVITLRDDNEITKSERMSWQRVASRLATNVKRADAAH